MSTQPASLDQTGLRAPKKRMAKKISNTEGASHAMTVSEGDKMDRLPHEKGFHVSWDQLHRDSRALAWRLDGQGPAGAPWRAVVAITRGGMAPAMIVARGRWLMSKDALTRSSFPFVSNISWNAVVELPAHQNPPRSLCARAARGRRSRPGPAGRRRRGRSAACRSKPPS